VYITRDDTPADASARLATGNTLIWSTRQVVLRLEGNLSQTAALASPTRRAETALSRAGTCHRVAV